MSGLDLSTAIRLSPQEDELLQDDAAKPVLTPVINDAGEVKGMGADDGPLPLVLATHEHEVWLQLKVEIVASSASSLSRSRHGAGSPALSLTHSAALSLTHSASDNSLTNSGGGSVGGELTMAADGDAEAGGRVGLLQLTLLVLETEENGKMDPDSPPLEMPLLVTLPLQKA